MDISNNALRKMEDILHRNALLPLKEMALRKVVASFWIDVPLPLWLKMNERESLRVLDHYEVKVKDKASKVLPTTLKEHMMYIARPIGSSILNWVMYHKHNFDEMREDYDLHTLKQLCWTCKGSIDYKKTAKNIIQLEMFSVKTLYKLACLYCLEDDIHILWEKLPEESKKCFHREIQFDLHVQLEHYWTCLLSGQEYKLNIVFKKGLTCFSHQEFAFLISAFNGYKAATEYFFQKLTNKERVSSLLTAFKIVIDELDSPRYWGHFQFRKENLSIVLNYLLSQMKPDMLALVLSCYPFDILISFLDWQLEDHFVEVADVFWTTLPKIKYNKLLSVMHTIFINSGYCPESFQDFFLHSPSDFRKEFVDYECESCHFLSKFFEMQDSKTVGVIFENIDASDRVKLVFKLICNFISTNKQHMVELCLQEAKLSNENRERLKKDILKFIAATDGGVSVKERACKRKWFCELIGETYVKSPDDKSSDDEMHSRVKKLCSENKANVLPQI